MRGIKKILAGTVLSASMAFTGVASAMQIPQYEKMAQVDRDDYRVTLVEGTIKALNDQRQPDQAQKLTAFFLDKSDNGGFTQLSKNIEILKAIDKENAANPNNKEPVSHIETALMVTMKIHGITPPLLSTLLAINKDFKPSQPGALVRNDVSPPPPSLNPGGGS